MFKKSIYLILFLCSFSSCAQNKIILFSKNQKLYPKINIPFAANIQVTKAADQFNENFKLATGETLIIERSNTLNKNETYILLRTNPTQKSNFCFFKKNKNITIQGNTAQNLVFGITDFFKRYSNLNFQEKNLVQNQSELQKEIAVPKQFSICDSPAFEYREPYYSPNFQPEFRAWNKTNYLELEWGIWGHNLPKILKEYNLPQSVYAKVGNKRVQNQFCFTSEELFNLVNEKVKGIYNTDHALDKYMILPNDNTIVCSCDTCKAAGNTSADAAPAVFSFLNKLAKSNQNLAFFTTAYTTVKEIPNFKAEDNTGIFYSTIGIQKGIPIEDSEYFKTFENDMKRWRAYVKNVYIWDYTVNFDNYFDIYPVIKVSQKNLKLYQKLGVNGIFFHGSEYNYSTFQELKATLLAKLLWNPDINVDEEITDYFHHKFPEKLAEDLTIFYLFIDNTFLKSNQELSIYSGIQETVKKYLDSKIFFDFYDKFDTYYEDNKLDKEYLRIATGLTFLKLEIMRNFGLDKDGFGVLTENNEISVKEEISILLDKLASYSRSSDLKTYNEVQYKINDYIASWRETVSKYHKRKHYFYKKPFEVISKLDEDYKDINVLNDGAFGLKDYNTNWHITSIDDLVLKIEKRHISESKQITFSFLQDTKHAIFFPASIAIYNLKGQIIKRINLINDSTKIATKEVTISLPTALSPEQLPDSFIMKVTRQPISGKNAMACDEIIFN